MTDRSHILGRAHQYIRAPALIDGGGRPNLVTPFLSPCKNVSFSLLLRIFSPVSLSTVLYASKLTNEEDDTRGGFGNEIDEGTIGVEGSLGIFSGAY